MHIARYFVTFRDGDWRIRYADTFYGPYDRQKTAISQAIDMALIVGQSGGRAEVLVESESGEARLEWPLSHDLSAIEEQRFLASYGGGAMPPPASDIAPSAPAAPIEEEVASAGQPVEDDAEPDPVPEAGDQEADDEARDEADEDEARDDDADESLAPPQESSIEELAAIMTAALDGAEPSSVVPEEVPTLDPLVANDEGPIAADADPAAR